MFLCDARKGSPLAGRRRACEESSTNARIKTCSVSCAGAECKRSGSQGPCQLALCASQRASWRGPCWRARAGPSVASPQRVAQRMAAKLPRNFTAMREAGRVGLAARLAANGDFPRRGPRRAEVHDSILDS